MIGSTPIAWREGRDETNVGNVKPHTEAVRNFQWTDGVGNYCLERKSLEVQVKDENLSIMRFGDSEHLLRESGQNKLDRL